jgi:hypothetical protein
MSFKNFPNKITSSAIATPLYPINQVLRFVNHADTHEPKEPQEQ